MLLYRWLPLVAALALTVLLYLPALGFAFVHDDLPQIVSNPDIANWRRLPQYFSGDMWRARWFSGVYYRPLTLVWLLLCRSVVGLNPALWHLASLLLHATVTFLVFKLALRLTHSNAIASLAAMIFGIHPAHIESVVWVSGFPDPLTALFLLSAMLCFLGYEEGRRLRNLAWSIGFYLLSLFTKETALLFPAVVFVYGIAQKGSRNGEDTAIAEASGHRDFPARKKLCAALQLAAPFTACASFYLGVRLAIFHGFAKLADVPFFTTVLTIPSVLFFYLRHLVWPAGLSLFYDSYYVNSPTLRAFWAPLLALALVAAGLVMLSRKDERRAVALASWWLLLFLLPAMNFRAFFWREIEHDRYLYLPSIGFAILVAVLLGRLARTYRIAAVAILAGALAMGTELQIGVWATPLLLYYHAVQIAPHNVSPVVLLAAETVARGRLEEATDLYVRATELAPNWGEAWYDLSQVQYRRQQYQAAERSLVRATELDPNNVGAFYLLGLARMQTQQWRESELALRAAIALQPGNQEFRSILAVVQQHLHDQVSAQTQ